ncbi:MAG: hypothetical protein V4580_05015 [Bacteroidota bacterium]
MRAKQTKRIKRIKQLLCFLIVMSVTNVVAQKMFHLQSQAGVQLVSVNGKKYKIDVAGTKIKTRYPKFDALIFLTDAANSNELIVCNFKPDSSYAIAGACCGSLDIIPNSKFKCDSLKYWDPEKDADKIQNHFLDKPFLSVKTAKTPKDSVYAWHSDAACLTEHKLIGTEAWALGVPPKCFYWSNITPILFFKTDATSDLPSNKDVAEFLQKANVIELATIYLRLFDNQKFMITFDEESRTVKIAYDIITK